MDRARRQPLTPLSLFVAFVTLFLLAAIGSAQLFNFGESARATTCRNNLKQLGLATVIYETSRGG
jgi:hypothetical protein